MTLRNSWPTASPGWKTLACAALPQLASAAQADEHVAEVLAQFTAQRQAALRVLLAHLLAAGAADAMQPSRPGKGG
jgi:hypothetical protein